MPSEKEMSAQALGRGRQTSHKVFEKLRDMAIAYEFKPGERLNEVALAERLGVSRTPIRQALQLLARDGFLVASGRGYMRRPLAVKEMIDLYETREAVEVECLRLAGARASPQQMQAWESFLAGSQAVPPGAPVPALVQLDERFHEMLAEMSGNQELLRILRTVNERIRFIRWINMERVGRNTTQTEHAAIIEALRAGRVTDAQERMRSHITQRTASIRDSVAQGLTRIFLDDDDRMN